MCSKFTIYGERCSGTNYLEEIMLANFDIVLTWDYGWKHFFGFYDFKNTEEEKNTLFLGIVRNPVNWINSFYKNQHHVGPGPRNLIDFLSKKFYSVIGDNTIIKEDLNYTTNKIYKNIFELRFCKNYYLINIMPQKVKNYQLVTYENLKNKYDDVLTLLQSNFNLIRKFALYEGIKYYKKEKNVDYCEKKISLRPYMVTHIINSVNRIQENKMGYLL